MKKENKPKIKMTIEPVTKVCVICQKVIGDKEDYFKVTLFSGGKDKGTDYAHRICWLERNKTDKDLRRLIEGVTQYAKRQGVIA